MNTEQYNVMKQAIKMLLAPHKTKHLDYVQNNANEHWLYCKENKPKLDAKFKRLSEIRRFIESRDNHRWYGTYWALFQTTPKTFFHKVYKTHLDIDNRSSSINLLEMERRHVQDVIKLERAAYILKQTLAAKLKWEANEEKLINLLDVNNIDLMSTETTRISCSYEEGFQLVAKLTNGKELSCSLIWCAEHSDKVTAHTRFISKIRKPQIFK